MNLILVPFLLFFAWVFYNVWIMASAYDWHLEEESKQKKLLRPIHGTKEEIKHGLNKGTYIICGNEIHRAEAHFPTTTPEYPTAFKVSWKIDKIIESMKDFVYHLSEGSAK